MESCFPCLGSAKKKKKRPPEKPQIPPASGEVIPPPPPKAGPFLRVCARCAADSVISIPWFVLSEFFLPPPQKFGFWGQQFISKTAFLSQFGLGNGNG